MKNYNLIALDIIDGLDNKFYVVDINGIIGVRAIIQYKEQFDKRIFEIFGEMVNIECSKFVYDGDKIIAKTNSDIVIKNLGFKYESKIDWRKVYDLPCPRINANAKPHSHSDYPKYLLKPEFSFKGRGITLLNSKATNEDMKFIEEFIPSKLINGHCYSIRVIMIIGKSECHPLLFLNKICKNPIIKDLHDGILNKKENLSYISNLEENTSPYIENKDPKLKAFVKTLNFYDV